MTVLLVFLLLIASLVIGIVGYAAYYIKHQGDSHFVLENASIEAPPIGGSDPVTFTRAITFKNIGTQEGVLVDVRVSAPETAGIQVEPAIVRTGTSPTDLSYWVSNILEPGESCEGLLTVGISAISPDALAAAKELSVIVNFDEVGRSPLITRSEKIKIAVSVAAKTEES